jgi:hypothetical protein
MANSFELREAQPADPLSVLAIEIQSAHAEAVQAARKSVETMILAGDKLIQAKSLVPHGQWGQWLRDQCRIPARTATRYMKLARKRTILEDAIENGHVADLSVRMAEGVITDAEIKQWRQREVQAARSLPNRTDCYQLIHGDMADAPIQPNSIDAVITDLPYPREYLHLYSVLAERASEWLKAGGSLLTLASQAYLPEVLERLTSSGLQYQWTLACFMRGKYRTAQVYHRHTYQVWKPAIWLTKGQYQGCFVRDACTSDVCIGEGRDKRFHVWGQEEPLMTQIIERFSKPNDLICDPAMGGGTTGAVALKLGRRFIGIEIDPQAFATAKVRISSVLRGDQTEETKSEVESDEDPR